MPLMSGPFLAAHLFIFQAEVRKNVTKLLAEKFNPLKRAKNALKNC